MTPLQKKKKVGFINKVDDANWPPQRVSIADILSIIPLSEWMSKANAWKVSSRDSLQRPICILNSGDRTNLSFFFLLVFVPLRSDNLAFHLHRNEYFLSNQMIKITTCILWYLPLMPQHSSFRKLPLLFTKKDILYDLQWRIHYTLN